MPTPLTLFDFTGDNYVDSITRKTDEHGIVYYEVSGRNNNNQSRILHIYDNNKIEAYVEVDGVKKKASSMGAVHNQFLASMPEILQHFSLSALDFSQSTPSKKPPAIIPKATKVTLPSKEFFIAAAQRAMKLGDVVSAKQKGAHHTRQVEFGPGSNYYDEGNSTRLNLFHELASETKDGYYHFAATTAYGLSLLTYIAAQYDKLEKEELERLYQIYQCVAGDIPALSADPDSPEYRLALAKGLKAEVNEVTALREISAYGASVDTPLAAYSKDLVEGNSLGRPVVDKKSQKHYQAIGDSSLKRQIPSFFPIPPGSGATDHIVLQAGGCKTHSAIVCIWKQGVDKEGNPVLPGDGKTIDQYKVYRTVCNAGFGTTYDVRTNPPALYHEIFSPAFDGKTYSVCTQEVLLPEGVAYSDIAMQKQITKLVEAEHALLLFHDLPGKQGPQGETGTMDPAKQAQWRAINESVRLGPVETTHSALSAPQKTGNCTMRSIGEYLRWEMIRSGVSSQDAAATLNNHLTYARANNSASIEAELAAAEAQVTTKKSPVIEIVDDKNPLDSKKDMSLAQMNIVKPASFFTNPVISQFPQYNPDNASDAESDLLVQEIRAGVKYCPKPTMMYLNELIHQASNQSNKTKNSNSTSQTYLLQGCDSRLVAGFSAMQGAVRQIASQFNNGESQGRYLTQPNKFKQDRTQGPAEQRTSGGAAIARYAYSDSCDVFGMLLADPVIKAEFDGLFDYQYGFLTPKGGKEQEGLKFLKTHINKLVLNVERVAIDNAPGQTAIQVLNSGLALGGYDAYDRTEAGTHHLIEMTEMLLTAQYKAVAAVAILEAENNPKKAIPVSFTLIGGGAFGNDRTAIAKAVSEAIKLIKSSGLANIQVCLSIYSTEELDDYKKITQEGKEFADIREVLQQTPITQNKLHSMHTLVPEQKKIVEIDGPEFVKPSEHLNLKNKNESVKPETKKLIEPHKIDPLNFTNKIEIVKPDTIKPIDPPKIHPTSLKKEISEIKKIDGSLKTDKNPEKKKAQSFIEDSNVVGAMNAAIDALSTKSHLSSQGLQDKSKSLKLLLKDYREANSVEDGNKALKNFVIAASIQRESNWGSFFTSKFGETASAKAFFNHMNTPRLKKMMCSVLNISSNASQLSFKDFAKHMQEHFEGKKEESSPRLKGV